MQEQNKTSDAQPRSKNNIPSQFAKGCISTLFGKKTIALIPPFTESKFTADSQKPNDFSNKKGEGICSEASQIKFIFGGGQDKYAIFIRE